MELHTAAEDVRKCFERVWEVGGFSEYEAHFKIDSMNCDTD